MDIRKPALLLAAASLVGVMAGCSGGSTAKDARSPALYEKWSCTSLAACRARLTAVLGQRVLMPDTPTLQFASGSVVRPAPLKRWTSRGLRPDKNGPQEVVASLTFRDTANGATVTVDAWHWSKPPTLPSPIIPPSPWCAPAKITSSPHGRPLCYDHLEGHHSVQFSVGTVTYHVETPGPLGKASPAVEQRLANLADRFA
jgi:hypothetical protein